jgi:hypothetical protein
MNQLFLLKEYPNDVLPMYAQGYSVCRFLISQQGPRTFISFLEDYMRHPSWTDNIRKHYGYNSLAELQQYWLAWVSDGSGSVAKFAKNQIAVPAIQPTLNGNSAAGVVLAGGQRNNSSQVAQATVNPATGMELLPASVDQLALNPTQGRFATPITKLTSVGTVTAQQAIPLPKALPSTGPPAVESNAQSTGLAATGNAERLVSDGNDFYQRQQNQAKSIRTAQGDNGLSQIGTPMVPPSIRLSGQYGAGANESPFNEPPIDLARITQANNISQPTEITQAFAPAGNYQTAHPQPEQQISQGQYLPLSTPIRSQQSRLGSPQRY